MICPRALGFIYIISRILQSHPPEVVGQPHSKDQCWDEEQHTPSNGQPKSILFYEHGKMTVSQFAHYSIHSILTRLIVQIIVGSIERSTPANLVLQLNTCTMLSYYIGLYTVNTHIVYGPVGIAVSIGYDTV